MTRISKRNDVLAGLRALLLGCAITALSTSAALAADVSQIGPVIQGFLDATISQGAPQGIAVGVSLPGNTQTWTGAAGYADLAGTQPLTPDMQFRIGSASKTFTGTVVMRQIDQGLINLNDPINKWVPDLNVPGGNQITVRNLLGMTSGIPDYLVAQSLHIPNTTVLQEWANFTSPTGPYGTANYTPEQLVQAASALTSGFKPIGQMAYSNTNFVLLGIIAQRASCLTAAGCQTIEGMVNSMTGSIGLGTTTFPTTTGYTAKHPQTPQSVLSEASMYGVPYGSVYNMTYVDPRVPWSAGALLSTPADELVWVRQIATNNLGLLSPAMQQQRLTDTTPGSVAGVPSNYGLAIYSMPSVGSGVYLTGHSGLIGGNTSSLFYNPSLDIAYAINFVGYENAAQPWYPLFGATNAFGSAIYSNLSNGTAPYENNASAGAYTSVVVLWALDRNLTLAFTTQGSCSFGAGPQTVGGGQSCSGDNVRSTPISVSNTTLTIQPSNRTIGNYYIDPVTGNPSLIQVARPSLATFGSNMAAVSLQGSATLVLPTGAGLEIWGANSAGVAMTGDRNSAQIGGTIATLGASSVGVQVNGNLNTVNVQTGGAVNGSNGPAITMAGQGNQAIIAGTVMSYGNTYGTLAIQGSGSSNTVAVTSSGSVTGDIAMGSGANSVRVDGMVLGNIRMASTATTLSGTGAVAGYVGGGGIVSPGNSIGTLTVGTYFGQNTALVIETGPAGISDRLVVGGAASLTGGSLWVTPAVGGTSGVYNILQAGAVGGTFASASTGTRVGVGVQYTPTGVNVATANPFVTDAGARTGAADTMRTLDMFEQRATAFRTSTEVVPLLPGAGPTTGAPAPEGSNAEGLKNWFAQRGPISGGSRAAGAAVWAAAYGNASRFYSDGPVPTIASTGGGVMVGADAEVMPNLLLGAMGAYSQTNANGSSYAGPRFESEAYKVGAYGAFELGPVVLNASVLAGRGNDSTWRSTEFGSLSGVAYGGFDDLRIAGRLSALTTFEAGGFRLTPRAAVTLLQITQDPYSEFGGAGGYNYSFGRSTFRQVRPELTFAVGRTFLLASGNWTGRLNAEVRAGVAREMVVEAPDAWVSVTGFTPFAMGGFDRDAWVVPVSARVELNATDQLSVFASFDGAYSRLGTDNTVRGGLQWRF